MSNMIDMAIKEAETAMREALQSQGSPPDLRLDRSGVAALVSEKTQLDHGSGWGAPNPGGIVAGLITVNHAKQVARSVKIYNIAIDPLLALKNGLSAAKEASGLAGVGAVAAMIAKGTLAITGGVATLPLSAVAFLMAAHFTRRREIQYDQGCVFVLAWGVSEYLDGYHVFHETDLMASLPLMVDFGIHDYNAPKAKTALSRLQAWGAIEKRGDSYILHERLEVRS